METDQPAKKLKEKQLSRILINLIAWVAGVLFLIMAIIPFGTFVENRMNNYPMATKELLLFLESFFWGVMAAFLAPPIRSYMHKKTGKTIQIRNRFIILISLFSALKLSYSAYDLGFSFSLLSKVANFWFWCILIVIVGFSLNRKIRKKTNPANANET